jgi:hypothetical protein
MSCKKDGAICSGNKKFCTYIEQEDYQNAGSIIDKYLNKQKKSLSDSEKLKHLRDWLNCKSCVSNAEVFCNSCIYTLPAQSELNVTFLVKGKQVDKALIIIIVMDEPLKFSTFNPKN